MGLKAAQSEYACVMDGDLQHPPEMLPVMLKTALDQKVDLVVATRRAENSQVAGLNAARNLISRALDLTARIFFPRQLHGVSDPLAGFFLVRVKASGSGCVTTEWLQNSFGYPRAQSKTNQSRSALPIRRALCRSKQGFSG